MRARGWGRPPLRVEIDKRIPVAAGLGGGSADAAAVLRLAAGELDDLPRIAAGLGADVPSQLDPRFALVGGAGETVEPLQAPGEFALVLIGDDDGLSTAEVYAEADCARDRSLSRGARPAHGASARGCGRRRLAARLRRAAGQRPRAGGGLVAPLDRRGARRARRGRRRRVLVSGSGPTAVGLFDDLVAADAAISALPPRYAQRDRLGAAAPRIIPSPVHCGTRKARSEGPARVIVAV